MVVDTTFFFQSRLILLERRIPGLMPIIVIPVRCGGNKTKTILHLGSARHKNSDLATRPS